MLLCMYDIKETEIDKQNKFRMIFTMIESF